MMAGAFSGSPSIEKCEPWHVQSQQVSNEFQLSTHPACVQAAERS
jgi:hypothetical protein